jgi:hypothetical protein
MATGPKALDTPSASSALLSPSPSTQPFPTATLTFSVGTAQAQMTTTLVRFVDAFNAGDVEAALAFLSEDIVGNDCDYRRQVLIEFRDKGEAARWLRGRAADNDRLELFRIYNENPDSGSGWRVVGVVWARRTSQSLDAPLVSGIGAKVVFTDDGQRIRAFAMGAAPCDPRR